MLPSGSTTLLNLPLGDHPALAFTCDQYFAYVSSPKYHAQPAGLSDDESVNETVSGAGPYVLLAVKLATGAAADVPGINMIRSKHTTMSEINKDGYLITISSFYNMIQMMTYLILCIVF
jgi:hypothetical protein